MCISAGGGITMVSLSYIHGKEKSAIGHFDELGEESETQISTSYSNQNSFLYLKKTNKKIWLTYLTLDLAHATGP